MPNIGPLEIAIVLLIVLIIFGPKRLPGLGKSVGTGMREFKESITGENKDEDDKKPAPTLTQAAPAEPAAPAPAATASAETTETPQGTTPRA